MSKKISELVLTVGLNLADRFEVSTVPGLLSRACTAQQIVDIANANSIVSSWAGVATPVDVTAGRNIDITSGEIRYFTEPSEVVGPRDVLADLFEKNCISSDVLGSVLTIQLNASFVQGSSFRMFRNSAGAYTLSAVPGVTINGVDAASLDLFDAYDGMHVINISDNEWLAVRYSSENINLTAERVAITNASGEITTSEFLKYIPVTEVLESNAIITNSIQSLGAAKIFPSQNVVNADRALDQQDLGVILSNGGVGKINLPAVGDTTLSTSASFYIWEPSAIPLTVQAPAGVLLNGVDGGSVATSGAGSIITVVRNVLSSNSWHSTKYSDTLEDAYTQGNGEIDLISGKPLVLNSTTAGSRDPEMTVAQFNAIAAKINGEKAFASDTQRPIIETSAGVKQFAYTDDIPEYGEMYFNDSTTETVIVAPATPVKIAGTYISGLLSGFTHSGLGAMIYVGTGSIFKLSVSLSCTFNSSSGSVSAIIYQNGLPISKSKQQSELGPTSPGAQNICCMALVSLATNDSVEIFIQNDSGSENIIVTQLSCNTK